MQTGIQWLDFKYIFTAEKCLCYDQHHPDLRLGVLADKSICNIILSVIKCYINDIKMWTLNIMSTSNAIRRTDTISVYFTV